MLPAYLSYFLGLESDDEKNPAKNVVRGLVVGLTLSAGFLFVFTLIGIVLLFPRMLPDKIFGLPGVWWFATIHYLCSAVLIVFLLGHLYLATMGDRIGYLLSAMITGWHKHHKKKEEEAPPDS